ncbi:unnamed protein product [Closterium sp. NIES-54]
MTYQFFMSFLPVPASPRRLKTQFQVLGSPRQCLSIPRVIPFIPCIPHLFPPSPLLSHPPAEAFPDVPPRKHKHKAHEHEQEQEQPQQATSADASQAEKGEAERDIRSHGADSRTAAEHAPPSTQYTPGEGISAPPQQFLHVLSADVPAWVAERASAVSPEVVAIASVYFVQGVLGLARLAVTFLLKDDFGLDPAEVAVLSGLSSLPWLIKPIYGFISDGIPLFGYRRRSYLVACGLLGSVAWGALASVVGDKYSAVAMILLSSLSAAVSDVVVDSMVVQRARGESQATSGGLQSLCWGSSAVGAVLSAYFSGSLIENYGTRFVFGVTALLPLITTAVGFYVPEERVTTGTRVTTNKDSTTTGTAARGIGGELERLGEGREKGGDRVGEGGWEGGAVGGVEGGGVGVVAAGGGARETWAWAWGQVVFLWETIRQPAILLPTAFIFLWQATPHSETAMFFFTTNELGFGPEFLGRVRLVTALASLAGVGVFNFYLKEVPLRKLFLWTNIAGALLGSTQLLLVTGLNRSLGISDQYFLLGDSLILTVLGQISFMPVLVLAARVCPPGIEATLFATLMSVSNGASVFGGVMGAGLTNWLGVTSSDFTNLPTLIAICNFSSLLVLPFLNLLPAAVSANSDSEEEQ